MQLLTGLVEWGMWVPAQGTPPSAGLLKDVAQGGTVPWCPGVSWSLQDRGSLGAPAKGRSWGVVPRCPYLQLACFTADEW